MIDLGTQQRSCHQQLVGLVAGPVLLAGSLIFSVVGIWSGLGYDFQNSVKLQDRIIKCLKRRANQIGMKNINVCFTFLYIFNILSNDRMGV